MRPRHIRQTDTLDDTTAADIGRWRTPAVFALFIAVTIGLMALRSIDVSWGWSVDSEEFGAIGQWVGGIASALAVYIALSSLVDERRRDDVTARRSEARQVHYALEEDPDPIWVVRNDSTRRVAILEAAGDVMEATPVDPGGAVKIRDASVLSAVGWYGQPPAYPLVFWDGEYEWTITEDQQLTGVRRGLRGRLKAAGEPP